MFRFGVNDIWDVQRVSREVGQSRFGQIHFLAKSIFGQFIFGSGVYHGWEG